MEEEITAQHVYEVYKPNRELTRDEARQRMVAARRIVALMREEREQKRVLQEQLQRRNDLQRQYNEAGEAARVANDNFEATQRRIREVKDTLEASMRYETVEITTPYRDGVYRVRFSRERIEYVVFEKQGEDDYFVLESWQDPVHMTEDERLFNLSHWRHVEYIPGDQPFGTPSQFLFSPLRTHRMSYEQMVDRFPPEVLTRMFPRDTKYALFVEWDALNTASYPTLEGKREFRREYDGDYIGRFNQWARLKRGLRGSAAIAAGPLFSEASDVVSEKTKKVWKQERQATLIHFPT